MSKDWIWMPHPGHLIVSSSCRFHLNTYVNGYIVSTVGEYLPGEGVREILAQSRGVTLEGKGDAREYDYLNKLGFEDLGYGRKYETMVFEAMEASESCCPYRQKTGTELEMEGYNDAGAAREGHMAMCLKWSRK